MSKLKLKVWWLIVSYIKKQGFMQNKCEEVIQEINQKIRELADDV